MGSLEIVSKFCMKNILLFSLFLIISLVFVVSRYFINVVPNESIVEEDKVVERKTLAKEYGNAVWDWQPLKREDTDTFFSDLQARGVNSVYMNIGDYVDIHEIKDDTKKGEKTEEFNTKVKEYINTAQEYGISVHALAGNVDWGNSSHRYLNEIVIEYTRSFNKNNPEIKFQGVQFDIEPYSQEGFATKNREAIFLDYLDTVSGIVSIFDKYQGQDSEFKGMKLGFVIPYWFDGETEYSKKIIWNGEEKYLFYHILNRMNRIQGGYLVIMAYRNFAEGSGGSIEHSLEEVKFAQQNTPRVRIVIGQETSDVEPERITFFTMPFNNMVDEVKKISTRYEIFPNFGGFAFNNADSFLGLDW